MKSYYWSVLTVHLALALALSGCGSQGSVAASPTAASPGSLTASAQAPIAGTSSPGQVTASANVIPDQTSNMAFVISAAVKQVAVKEGDRVLAGQTLVVLDTPALEFGVAKAQADLVSAQAHAKIVRQGRKIYIKRGQRWFAPPSMRETRQQADIQVLQAQAALDIARGKLAEGSLVAPFDGTVVSINISPGETVQPEQIVAVIGDLEHLRVETTDLSEREIAHVQIGQNAQVRLKAFDQQLTGKVFAIAPMATQYKGDTVYKVTIELDQQPAGLLWGMSGDVDIQTQ